MKNVLFFALIIFLVSCGEQQYPKADNELVATQNFLDACMKGDFKQANFYMLHDSENEAGLNKIKDAYYHYDGDKRAAYRAANIIIQNDEAVDTTIKIVTYQNSLDKNVQKLKAINQNGEWKIDLKYTFSGNL